ncbi:MAG: hypothetical protein H5T96_09255 [Tissierellales bacterium]|nr:hypothetical protein [Tissierellales bacterium]
MTIAEKYYQAEIKRPSDINEHLVTLQKYALECEHITEMGVRDIVSTWALLMGKPIRMISYDIELPKDSNRLIQLKNAAKELNVDFELRIEDVLKVQIESTDLLFIDTLHRGSQLKKELALHSWAVNKYIILHDTTTFALRGESDRHRPEIEDDGLTWALEEFLQGSSVWEVHEVFKNCNGLTILKRT